MSHMYSKAVAESYAAYRPPIHRSILERALGSRQFEHGLDVGCGAGHSSVALAVRCQKVMGVDISAEMLTKSIAHEAIRYRHFGGLSLPFPDDTFDLATFAGSLFYISQPSLMPEILRTSTASAIALVYDFAVDLSPIWADLKVSPPRSDYCYSVRIDRQFAHLQESREQEISFNVTSHELLSLLLSESLHWDHRPSTQLMARSAKHYLADASDSAQLKAKTYFAIYTLNK